ncbi:MAG: universal stress protein [Planctomycetaceae bacterium]|nr:universal stress protein [Planctomycetaceae bacterium]
MKSRFQRIIFPTDFSPTADAALKTAAAFAAKHRAELHIIHVVDVSAYMYAGYPYADLTAEMMRSAAKRLQHLKLPAAAKKIMTVPVLLQGDIGSEITAYAAKIKADLIVMASHARKSVARFFLGSVADRLLHSARCPVLVMRAPASPKFKAEKGFKRIAVPTDFSTTADVGLGRAMELAREYKAEVHIVHAVERDVLGILPPKMQKEANRQAEKLTKDKLAELASWDKSNLKIKTAVLDGEPADAMAAYVQKAKCDLVVIGSHGRGEISRLILGSVADRLLRLVECPVFVERARS